MPGKEQDHSHSVLHGVIRVALRTQVDSLSGPAGPVFCLCGLAVDNTVSSAHKAVRAMIARCWALRHCWGKCPQLLQLYPERGIPPNLSNTHFILEMQSVQVSWLFLDIGFYGEGA